MSLYVFSYLIYPAQFPSIHNNIQCGLTGRAYKCSYCNSKHLYLTALPCAGDILLLCDFFNCVQSYVQLCHTSPQCPVLLLYYLLFKKNCPLLCRRQRQCGHCIVAPALLAGRSGWTTSPPPTWTWEQFCSLSSPMLSRCLYLMRRPCRSVTDTF